MRFDPKRHNRRSIRLRGYDYAQAGAYFVTIRTQGRECLFGQVANGEMRLNDAGRMVRDEWLRSAVIRPRVRLDAYVVMPNHVHGIIVLTDDGRGTLQRAPTDYGRCPYGQCPYGRCPYGLSHRSPLHHSPPDGAPTIERFGKPTSDSIPTIVRLFKSATTRRINEMRAALGVPVWQRNYEHVIREDESLNRIRQYVVNNPAQWANDDENPEKGRG